MIDTEEEFDWEAPFDRSATSVTALRQLKVAQKIFDELGIHPVYVVDYPVASSVEGREPLQEIAATRQATIGAHLHPWVSPPHDEEVNARNSYTGNLPPELEQDKIRRLVDSIEQAFGSRPTVYKAGRYGFGPNTGTILEAEGFEIDLSFCPPFDFSADGGPDYSTVDSRPFWFGRERRLLEIPCTGAYLGALRRIGAHLDSPALRRTRLPGLLARSRLLDRLHLSPEGYSLSELIRLTRSLFDRGQRVFSLSFHSPSLEPGHTTYVRTRSDLERFLVTLRSYFEFFLGELGGISRAPLDLKRHLAEVASP